MEAALDLGATHTQAFRKILLPFLKPAFASAAVIAFLASFENYNTTTFTFGTYPTLTIELAQKVRYGINPSISALAVIIVGITVVAALAHEAYKRREVLAVTHGAPIGTVKSGLKLPGFLASNPAAIVLVLVGFSFIGTLWASQIHDPAACKLEVREIKRQEAEQRRLEMLQRREEQRQKEQMKGPDIFAPVTPTEPAPPIEQPTSPGQGSFGDVFNPGNLGGDAPGGDLPEEAPEPESQLTPPESPGQGSFGNVFDPSNLGGDAPSGDLPGEAPGPESQQTPTESPGQGSFGDVFNPGNLGGDVPSGDLPEEAPGSESQQTPTESPGQGSFGNVFDPSNLGAHGSSGQP